MSQAIMGSFKECLRHFFDNATKSEMKAFRVAVSAPVSTLGYWKRGRTPTGETSLKLMVLLERIGYEVSEMIPLSEDFKIAMRLISLDFISVTDFGREGLGYETKPKVRVLGILFGRFKIVPKKARKLASFISEHKHLLGSLDFFDGVKGIRKRKLSEAKNGQNSNRHYKHPRKSSRVISTSKVDHFQDRHLRKVSITSFAEQTRALLPLAELLASDEFTSEERQQLRESAGRKTMFQFSTALNKLCGEKSREIEQAKGI